MEKDPVCGMDVKPERAAGQSQHQGHTYYFCSEHCKKEFDQNPNRYAQTASAREPQRT